MREISISLLILLSFSYYALGVTGNFPNLCASKDVPGSTPLPQIKIVSPYKVSAVFTNWVANSTKIISEVRTDKTLFIESEGREQHLVWSNVGDEIVLQNNTDCVVVKIAEPFTLPDDITKAVSLNNSSLSDIVNGIIDMKLQGFNSYVRIVSGVEGVGWLGCLSLTNSSAIVAIEVVYAGTDSIAPPSKTFNNPVILSLGLTYYTNATDVNSTLTARVSFDFSPFNAPSADDSKYQIGNGIICRDLPIVNVNITFSDQFSSLVTHIHQDGTKNHSKFTYDSRRNMSAETIDGGNTLIMNKSFSSDSYLVVHDFTHGSEFIFSSSPSCLISSLGNGSRDITSSQLASAAKLFIPNFENLKFSFYRNSTVLGKEIIEYRAVVSDKESIQIIVDGNILVSVTTYIEGLQVSSYQIAMESSDSFQLTSTLSDCFNYSNVNTVSFIISDVGLDKIHLWRSDVVSENIKESLSLLSNISPHRFSLSYTIDHIDMKNTGVILGVADKWDEKGDEVSADEFIRILNETLCKGHDWPIHSLDGIKKEIWKSPSRSLVPYPPPPPPIPPSFNGYTGGAMFVLALFMLMFGVGIGTGGVYIMTRRQRISTLAYQVFE